MTVNHLTTKNLAAFLAFGGLVVLMVQDRPNWNATCLAILCLIACGCLWLLSRRPLILRAPARRIQVEIISSDDSGARRLRLLEGHPGELEFLSPGRPGPASVQQRRLSAPRKR